MSGDYGADYPQQRKYLTQKRCMIESQDSEDYCHQFCGIVLDFMFTYSQVDDRTALLR